MYENIKGKITVPHLKILLLFLGLSFTGFSYSDSGFAVGGSINSMLSKAACNVIEKRKVSFGRGYTIKVNGMYHSGRRFTATSFGADRDHAIAKFLCQNSASEMKQFKYHKIK